MSRYIVKTLNIEMLKIWNGASTLERGQRDMSMHFTSVLGMQGNNKTREDQQKGKIK